MKVNGKQIPLKQEISLLDFLEQQGYEPSYVAVEYNGDVVPRGTFGQVSLADSDTLEVVRFVGGG